MHRSLFSWNLRTYATTRPWIDSSSNQSSNLVARTESAGALPPSSRFRALSARDFLANRGARVLLAAFADSFDRNVLLSRLLVGYQDFGRDAVARLTGGFRGARCARPEYGADDERDWNAGNEGDETGFRG